MIHYHCADIRPRRKLLELAGRHLLISHHYPSNVEVACQISATLLLDNGAFSVWRSGGTADWRAYYDWVDKWLDVPTTWAIIPDVIDAGPDEQDRLLSQWCFKDRGAPVWHLDEPLDRLSRLIDEWPRVCLGSAGAYAAIGTVRWHNRMVAVFNLVSKRSRLPWLHGLRMQGVQGYPFGSVDSADIARNKSRPGKVVEWMAERWDKKQPPLRWEGRPEQEELIA